MSWLEILTSTPVLVAGALGITAAVYARRHTAQQAKEQAKDNWHASQAGDAKGKMAQTVSHHSSISHQGTSRKA